MAKSKRYRDVDLRVTHSEFEMLHALTGGENLSCEIRGLIVDAYRAARNRAQANAIEFLRRAARCPTEAHVLGGCPADEAWKLVREVAAGGSLDNIRVSLRLRCFGWYAVIPAALSPGEKMPVVSPKAVASNRAPKSNTVSSSGASG